MKAKRTWRVLNDLLRDADEKLCKDLILKEQKGLNRKLYIARIHSRLNKARADRERKALGI